MTVFSAETLAFLADLLGNNTKAWFDSNRPVYERAVKTPAKWFLHAVEAELSGRTGAGWSGKIFRIHRDLRFSKDKTPYNTHIHVAFQETGTPKGAPTYMFGLEPGRLTLGAGIMGFTPDRMTSWRSRVAGSDAAGLNAILQDLSTEGAHFSDIELKRVPAPYDADDPNADLLRRKSLTAWIDTGEVEKAYGEGAPNHCAEALMTFRPLVEWLGEI